MAEAARDLPKTWEDLDAVPEGYTGEIIGGELVMHPRPNEPHSAAQSNLTSLLGGPFRFGKDGGPGGWVFRVEPRIGFSGDIRVPDLAGWRRTRFAAPRTGPLTVIPDWICEVLSEDSAAATDRSDKMPLHAASGVGHLWLADPELRTLEVFRLLGGRWLLVTTFHGDVTGRAEPFDAIELDLAPLWGEAA
ncbi:Uma2 family endonuclease [Sorangium sp. So ce1151]|uniref:Uma2 family endonuclease n=1 Tax=Sorangium sp. So ce1151 TaxID=3133332 RepID=UPI003F5EBF5E